MNIQLFDCKYNLYYLLVWILFIIDVETLSSESFLIYKRFYHQKQPRNSLFKQKQNQTSNEPNTNQGN